ncbi:helix-turn-helix domain-containing protein [Bradyrhizobium sp. LA7.1]|uniref:helix-turn-helix domain-containing protein n=1 Tax=Bradyrhizobium sp. LA7.1 TaxID=3156324 RepID=UPI0033911902
MEKKFLTPVELSERWGGRVNVRTLNNWRSSGKGPPFAKFEGVVLYRLEDLEKWENERVVSSTSEYGRS